MLARHWTQNIRRLAGTVQTRRSVRQLPHSPHQPLVRATYKTSSVRLRREQPNTDYENALSNILEDETIPIRINKVTPQGIILSDGLIASPSSIFLNGKVFTWTPPQIDPMMAMPTGRGWEEWTSDIWTLFELVSPRPEILILGTGNTVLPVPDSIKSYLNALGIQLDVQNTVSRLSK